MVIDGKSILHALVGEARKHFGELALRCRAVVCCRMSPMQKAEVGALFPFRILEIPFNGSLNDNNGSFRFRTLSF